MVTIEPRQVAIHRRSPYDHDVLRLARARGPAGRLCGPGPPRARAHGGRVPERGRRVRVKTYLRIFYFPFVYQRFATTPGAGDTDLRMTYCAFVVCALLDDWSCIDLARALSYIHRCRVRTPIPLPILCADARQSYEGGYGQTPHGESLGGPTYCALAALHLVPADHACASRARLQPAEWRATVRWLVHTQTETELGGGFAGRTNKLPDACYGFWCGAALSVRAIHLSLSLDWKIMELWCADPRCGRFA